MSWLLLTMVAASTATTSVEQQIARIVAGHDQLPSLAEVQSAAEEALSLSGAEEAESWATRARLRGLVPNFDARFGTDTNLDVRGEVSGDGWTRVGRGLGLDLSTRFTLGDLVFSDLELRASRERLARSAAIRLAKERVTRLYFQRVAVLLALRAEPTPERILDAARLDGLLRAATGGRLSSAAESSR